MADHCRVVDGCRHDAVHGGPSCVQHYHPAHDTRPIPVRVPLEPAPTELAPTLADIATAHQDTTDVDDPEVPEIAHVVIVDDAEPRPVGFTAPAPAGWLTRTVQHLLARSSR